MEGLNSKNKNKNIEGGGSPQARNYKYKIVFLIYMIWQECVGVGNKIKWLMLFN